MNEPTDIDAEIAEMLGFYRGAAMQAAQQQPASAAFQQTEETEYVPARSQRPRLCDRLASIGRISNPRNPRLARRIERRREAR